MTAPTRRPGPKGTDGAFGHGHGSEADDAIASSGTTVAIGLPAAVSLRIPLLRSIAFGGLLIPLVPVAVALTLLPVISAKLGPRAHRRLLRRLGAAKT